ncbi:class I SAM-dependent methyltransferase [Actinopolyspora erythraea]|uniref:Methyltransferase n=1 Tax=Actinopolyspora erythraea TaxID=414996 RepID=A0A099D6N9_9ACTN|nr:class I SAM-dependent methyltransferase [Actinopolyspora erythraea]ASU78218.1 class I SAM-dependent methyltransferase [Actinopolyspora erythraea]KGI81838.1 methyltransferase [Actinopolyspora erythraea]
MKSDAVHRVLETELIDARRRRGGVPEVLDIGGGSGVWAVPLAVSGCSVTVVDPSPNALAALRRRADEAGVSERVVAVQGDTDALRGVGPEGGADLVLGHGLLEYVDDVSESVRGLGAAVAPGGSVSVLVANRYAAVLARALTGRVSEALRLFNAPDGRLDHPAGETVRRRFDTDSLRGVLGEAGLEVELVQGQGVVSDLIPGSLLEGSTSNGDALRELEMAAAPHPPLRDVATRLHALARVPADHTVQ